MYRIGLLYSLIAAIVGLFLLFYSLEKKREDYFIFSLVFVMVSWSGIEWALWLLGHNLFELVFQPVVPLASFFVAWVALVIYLAEKHFKRRDWVGFLVAVGAIILLARACMDCL